MLNIVLIGITNELPKHDEKYELHRLIGHMCNLSQEIEDKAVARIVLNMHKIGYTSNQIADAVGISLAAVETIINEQKKAVKA